MAEFAPILQTHQLNERARHNGGQVPTRYLMASLRGPHNVEFRGPRYGQPPRPATPAVFVSYADEGRVPDFAGAEVADEPAASTADRMFWWSCIGLSMALTFAGCWQLGRWVGGWL